MLSAGMLTALASAMIVRSRGLLSASPPPFRAATVNSLMRRVKTLPRLASSAPFLCLIEAHLEWPDMSKLHGKNEKRREMLPLFRHDDPDVGAVVPGASPVVPEHGVDAKSGAFELARHLPDR